MIITRFGAPHRRNSAPISSFFVARSATIGDQTRRYDTGNVARFRTLAVVVWALPQPLASVARRWRDPDIIGAMKKPTCLLILLILLAACSGVPTQVVVVPTLASLPSATPLAPTTTPAPASATSMPFDVPSATPIPSTTPTMTLTFTLIPANTFTPTNTATETYTPSLTWTNSPTPTVTFTVTPSMTITDTITPLPSPTFTPSQELGGLGMLALLSERATILPPERLYNPPTLTAVALAAQTLIAGGVALTPSPVVSTPAFGTPSLATFPAAVNCPVPPPAALSADPTVAQSLGCPVGSITTLTTAVQSFEHGTMVYVQGSPGGIYVLTSDGRFRRFDDTWTSGEPETGGETPPLGLIEPKRGFGKVWRTNLDVRGSLGWGVTEEAGASSSVQLFDRGRAVSLPQRGEIYLLIDDPGGTTGTWRALPGGF